LYSGSWLDFATLLNKVLFGIRFLFVNYVCDNKQGTFANMDPGDFVLTCGGFIIGMSTLTRIFSTIKKPKHGRHRAGFAARRRRRRERQKGQKLALVPLFKWEWFSVRLGLLVAIFILCIKKRLEVWKAR